GRAALCHAEGTGGGVSGGEAGRRALCGPAGTICPSARAVRRVGGIVFRDTHWAGCRPTRFEINGLTKAAKATVAQSRSSGIAGATGWINPLGIGEGSPSRPLPLDQRG